MADSKQLIAPEFVLRSYIKVRGSHPDRRQITSRPSTMNSRQEVLSATWKRSSILGLWMQPRRKMHVAFNKDTVSWKVHEFPLSFANSIILIRTSHMIDVNHVSTMHQPYINHLSTTYQYIYYIYISTIFTIHYHGDLPCRILQWHPATPGTLPRGADHPQEISQPDPGGQRGMVT